MHGEHNSATQRTRPMEVGDLVKAIHVAENLDDGRSNVGFIVKVDRSSLTHQLRYWVKLFGGWNIGPAPFMGRQLEVISKST